MVTEVAGGRSALLHSTGMSATTSTGVWLQAPAASGGHWRFARAQRDEATGALSLEWELRRNCSLTPRQSLLAFGALGVVSMGIAAALWWQGATLVLPFAWVELLALAAAVWAYARHATDRERLRLHDGRLYVERFDGRQVQRVEFDAAWTRVEPARDERSLIELSGQGQRVAVGRHVRPELRESLARELRAALRNERRR